MRALIAIVLLMLVLGLIGWLRFSSPDGNPTIQVDTEKVKQDTAEIVEKSKQAVDTAAKKIDANIDSDPVKTERVEP